MKQQRKCNLKKVKQKTTKNLKNVSLPAVDYFTPYLDCISVLAKNCRIFIAVEWCLTTGPSIASKTTFQVEVDGNVSIQLRKTAVSLVVLSSLLRRKPPKTRFSTSNATPILSQSYSISVNRFNKSKSFGCFLEIQVIAA